MDIQIQCKACNKELTVRDRYRGLQVPCPSCGETIHIPMSESSSESTSPTPVKPATPVAPAVTSPPVTDELEIGDEDLFDTDDVLEPGMMTESLDDVVEETDAPAVEATDDIGSDTVAGKKILAASKGSKAIDVGGRKSFRNPVKQKNKQDDSEDSLLQRLERIREKKRSRAKLQYGVGLLVIILCFVLNWKVTLPIIFGDPQLLTVMGDSLAKMGNVDGAIGKYQKAIQVRSSYYFAYLRLGQAYAMKKEWASAEAILQKVVEQKDPELISQARVELAHICHARYKDEGDTTVLEQGLKHLEEAMLYNPMNQQAKDLRKDLFYDFYVPSAANNAFDYVAQNETLNAQQGNNTAAEKPTANEGDVKLADGTVVHGFFWKYKLYGSPQHYIRIMPPNNIVKGFLDLEITEYKSPPRDTLEAIREDDKKIDEFIAQEPYIETLEFTWRDGLWVKTFDPNRNTAENPGDTENEQSNPEDESDSGLRE